MMVEFLLCWHFVALWPSSHVCCSHPGGSQSMDALSQAGAEQALLTQHKGRFLLNRGERGRRGRKGLSLTPCHVPALIHLMFYF